MTQERDIWMEFFEATSDRGPRDIMVQLLEDAPHTGLALDLGCGAGHDTMALLKHGLRVHAVDGHAWAVQRTEERAAEAGLRDRLRIEQSRFEDFEPQGPYDILYSGFSLPFVPSEAFQPLWTQLRAHLAPGGMLALQLFGDRDEWADGEHETEATFHSRAEVDELTDGLERVFFDEVERDGHTALGDAKHWHVFHMILRRST